MALQRKDTPLAPTPEARFSASIDSIKPKVLSTREQLIAKRNADAAAMIEAKNKKTVTTYGPTAEQKKAADSTRAVIAAKRASDTKNVMNVKGFKNVAELRSWTAKNDKKENVDKYDNKACKMGKETKGCAGSERKSERRVQNEKNL